MPDSPIARNFERLRRLLMDELGLPPHAIHAEATFAHLVPPDERQRLWALLQREGLQAPCLSLPPRLHIVMFFVVLTWALAVALLYRSIVAFFIAAVEIAYLAWRCTRPWATCINPASMTLEEAAICMTSLEQCRQAGYRLSEHDIFVKVRLILWQSGVAYESITPEAKFSELFE